jgi:CrcB protein
MGGGLGAFSRYISTQFINNILKMNFPMGTLFVNTAGSFLIGFLYKTFETYIIPIELRLFIITGFLGGYTTFSTYSLETVQYIMDGNYKQALINIILNNILCIIFVFLGIIISKTIIK